MHKMIIWVPKINFVHCKYCHTNTSNCNSTNTSNCNSMQQREVCMHMDSFECTSISSIFAFYYSLRSLKFNIIFHFTLLALYYSSIFIRNTFSNMKISYSTFCKQKNLNIKPYCLMKSLLAWMKGNVGSIELEFFCLRFHPIHQEFMVSLQTFYSLLYALNNMLECMVKVQSMCLKYVC